MPAWVWLPRTWETTTTTYTFTAIAWGQCNLLSYTLETLDIILSGAIKKMYWICQISYLCFCNIQKFCHFGSFTRRQIFLNFKLFLEFKNLPSSKCSPSFFSLSFVATLLITRRICCCCCFTVPNWRIEIGGAVAVTIYATRWTGRFQQTRFTILNNTDNRTFVMVTITRWAGFCFFLPLARFICCAGSFTWKRKCNVLLL